MSTGYRVYPSEITSTSLAPVPGRFDRLAASFTEPDSGGSAIENYLVEYGVTGPGAKGNGAATARVPGVDAHVELTGFGLQLPAAWGANSYLNSIWLYRDGRVQMRVTDSASQSSVDSTLSDDIRKNLLIALTAKGRTLFMDGPDSVKNRVRSEGAASPYTWTLDATESEFLAEMYDEEWVTEGSGRDTARVLLFDLASETERTFTTTETAFEITGLEPDDLCDLHHITPRNRAGRGPASSPIFGLVPRSADALDGDGDGAGDGADDRETGGVLNVAPPVGMVPDGGRYRLRRRLCDTLRQVKTLDLAGDAYTLDLREDGVYDGGLNEKEIESLLIPNVVNGNVVKLKSARLTAKDVATTFSPTENYAEGEEVKTGTAAGNNLKLWRAKQDVAASSTTPVAGDDWQELNPLIAWDGADESLAAADRLRTIKSIKNADGTELANPTLLLPDAALLDTIISSKENDWVSIATGNFTLPARLGEANTPWRLSSLRVDVPQDWAAGVTYHPGDVVKHNSKWWERQTEGASTPAEDNHWNEVTNDAPPGTGALERHGKVLLNLAALGEDEEGAGHNFTDRIKKDLRIIVKYTQSVEFTATAGRVTKSGNRWRVNGVSWRLPDSWTAARPSDPGTPQIVEMRLFNKGGVNLYTNSGTELSSHAERNLRLSLSQGGRPPILLPGPDNSMNLARDDEPANRRYVYKPTTEKANELAGHFAILNATDPVTVTLSLDRHLEIKGPNAEADGNDPLGDPYEWYPAAATQREMEDFHEVARNGANVSVAFFDAKNPAYAVENLGSSPAAVFSKENRTRAYLKADGAVPGAACDVDATYADAAASFAVDAFWRADAAYREGQFVDHQSKVYLCRRSHMAAAGDESNHLLDSDKWKETQGAVGSALSIARARLPAPRVTKPNPRRTAGKSCTCTTHAGTTAGWKAI